MTDRFEHWVDATFERWQRDLTHQEIARALKALTRDYVQRRRRLRGKALSGRGKQAAFALYYGIRHYVIVRETLNALGDCTRKGLYPPSEARGRPRAIIDLGCGTGVAGAAWAVHCGGEPLVAGVELDPEVMRECAFTYKDLKLRGGAIRCHLSKYRWPKPPVGVIAAFTVNELEGPDRERLWNQLEKQVKGGSRVLILEPLATRITPWWREWAEQMAKLGGRADEWHFDVKLPEKVHLLGKSAGLRPERLGARTLWL